MRSRVRIQTLIVIHKKEVMPIVFSCCSRLENAVMDRANTGVASQESGIQIIALE